MGFVAPQITVNYNNADVPTSSSISFAENQTAAQIAATVNMTIDSHNGYTSSIDSGNDRQINFEANAAGARRDISITIVNQGSSNLLESSFATTITRQGMDGILTGELTTYTISIGGVDATSGTFDSQSTAAQMASTLVSAIGSISEYNAESQGVNGLRTTSTFFGSLPDIDIAFTGGTGSTASITKTIFSTGTADATNLSAAVWEYYVINQEVRVDDDTTAMMPDNTITIPQGLVVNTENITASSTTGTATAAMTYLTGGARSNLLITGGVSEIVALTSTGTTTHTHTLEYSTDSGANWTAFFTTQAFNPNFGATFAGQAFNNVQFVGAQINDIPAGSTVAFRGRDTGTAATGAWGFGFLVVEERNADMTT